MTVSLSLPLAIKICKLGIELITEVYSVELWDKGWDFEDLYQSKSPYGVLQSIDDLPSLPMLVISSWDIVEVTYWMIILERRGERIIFVKYLGFFAGEEGTQIEKRMRACKGMKRPVECTYS